MGTSPLSLESAIDSAIVNLAIGEGLVAHISVANPFCEDTSSQLEAAVRNAAGEVHRGGTFITIEGPRFSTRGESLTYRSWGMSIIGMPASPEAFLAREAEICYATMAHITDYASGMKAKHLSPSKW